MTAQENANFSSHSTLPRSSGQNWLSRLLAFILSAGLLVLGFMFSLVALAVVAVAGVILGGWLWWKTRQLRKQMRQQMAEAQGSIIEGEVIQDDQDLTTSYRRLS